MNSDRIKQPENIASSSKKREASPPDFAAGKLQEGPLKKQRTTSEVTDSEKTQKKMMSKEWYEKSQYYKDIKVLYEKYGKTLKEFMITHDLASKLYEETGKYLSKEEIEKHTQVTEKDLKKIIKNSNKAIKKYRYSRVLSHSLEEELQMSFQNGASVSGSPMDRPQIFEMIHSKQKSFIEQAINNLSLETIELRAIYARLDKYKPSDLATQS